MPAHSKYQSGVATLLISVVMLIVLGLMTLYNNRSIIVEQRTTTNQYKRVLAYEAAQAGLEQFIGFLNENPSVNMALFATQTGADWVLLPSMDNSAQFNPQGYLNTAGTYAHDFTLSGLKIAQTGTIPQAKDEAGNTITGQAQSYSIYLRSPVAKQFQLISRGCADTCDYAEAFVVMDFTVGSSPACPIDVNGNLEVVNGSSINGITYDVVGYDCGIRVGSLSSSGTPNTTSGVKGCKTDCNLSPYDPLYQVTPSISNDAHFLKYFGAPKATIKAASNTCRLGSPNATQADILAAIAGSGTCVGKENIWINGDLTFNASVGNLFYDGLATKGKSLIVDGDLHVNDVTLSMDGFLYVSGISNNNAPSSIGSSIHITKGSAAFAGDVRGKISLNVTAGAGFSKIPGGGGSGAQVQLGSGTWRDF